MVGFGVERTPSARARVVSRVERDRILRGENDGVRLDGLNGGLGVRCQDAIQGDLRVVEKALGARVRAAGRRAMVDVASSARHSGVPGPQDPHAANDRGVSGRHATASCATAAPGRRASWIWRYHRAAPSSGPRGSNWPLVPSKRVGSTRVSSNTGATPKQAAPSVGRRWLARPKTWEARSGTTRCRFCRRCAAFQPIYAARSCNAQLAERKARPPSQPSCSLPIG